MDCPSEKSMIEIKFSELDNIIRKMDFDFVNRKLVIYHDEKNDKITKLLNELNLGSTLDKIEEIELKKDDKLFINDDKKQRKMLITVFLINFSFFLLELGF